jgi:hypothetical protein
MGVQNGQPNVQLRGSNDEGMNDDHANCHDQMLNRRWDLGAEQFKLCDV